MNELDAYLSQRDSKREQENNLFDKRVGMLDVSP